ncbi:hypothetical protein [Bradyrhizobium brasilense]|uniref:Uncharacterized protein n=1 Tax=Bradyrhizobium brasilense TaxID=1419277 RepID=A0ABY8JA91_9BRAD|nr:hypothetical protein [Bradyrhizobium brasilense]WFU62480.1 hypothetical protein QA636_34105 [Bradyrhizobium brasilense]
MAKNSKNASSQIAEEHFPGWKATRVSSMEEGAEPLSAGMADSSSRRSADTTMPGLDELRKKYLGARDSGGTDSAPAPASDSTEDTDLVELESGPLKKVAAVSKTKKKVIWSQG